MTEKTQDKSKAHRRNRRIAFSFTIMSLLIIAAAYIWSRSRLPNIEERLAAIEAARAIPNSENAVEVYNDLLQDPNATSLLDHRPEFLDGETWNQTSTRPWLSTDQPQLAEWITDHQYIIDKLLQAAKFEKCRFPIVIDIDQTASLMERIKSMQQWAFLLSFASNNDLGEGRIDAAIAKWRCIIQMANHLRQQSASTEYIVGIRVETIAVKQASAYIVQGDPDEYQLHKIASLPIDTKNELDVALERIHPVDELMLLKFKLRLGVVDRLKYELGIGLIGSMKNSGNKVIRGEYEKSLAYKRGLHILVAMKRYQKQHHGWPKNLDAIRPRLSGEILVDPINKGEFVYRLTEDNFTLYSRGENNVDESGRYKSKAQAGPDDWPIWPPKGRKSQGDSTKNK